MQRLSSHTIANLPASVSTPGYDRSRVKAGILHLGVEAFHRAHQAVFTDTALNHSGGDWGIIGACMRNDTAANQLNPQDGLFTVRAEDADGYEQRLIGAVKRVLVAPREPATLDAVMADPVIRVITLPITEKGYYLGDDGWSLDISHAGIQRDLPQPEHATTAIGILARGLQKRRIAGAPPVSIISCDNLTENSRRLRVALIAYLERSYPAILSWVESAMTFPCSMVDRIVPAIQLQTL